MTGEPAQLLPECICLCACVRVFVCLCVSVPKSSSCLIHAMHSRTHSHVNPFTPALLWHIDFYFIALFIHNSRLEDGAKKLDTSRQAGEKQRLARCSSFWIHICALLPSYMSALFTSWAANHQCNFHFPTEMAIISLRLYIHFMIWLICWGSILSYWLR